MDASQNAEGAHVGPALTAAPLNEVYCSSEPVARATPAWNRTLQLGRLIHLDSTPGALTYVAGDDSGQTPEPDAVDVPQNGLVEKLYSMMALHQMLSLCQSKMVRSKASKVLTQIMLLLHHSNLLMKKKHMVLIHQTFEPRRGLHIMACL